MTQTRWFLLTDRKLKDYQLYGPFMTPESADKIGRALLDRGRIKGWTVVISQIPPRFENSVIP